MNAGGILPKLFLNDTNIYKIMVFVDLAAKPHRISWEANLGQVEIPFDSIPFYVVGFQVLECQHGKNRNLYQKQKTIVKLADNSVADNQLTLKLADNSQNRDKYTFNQF